MMDLTPFLTAVVRHGVTVAAGVLLEHGILMASDQQQFIEIASSIAMASASLAWSWWQKHHQQAEIQTAARTGTTP